MSIHNISILFVIAQNRERMDSKVPLFCRITYLKKRKQFATGIFINPKNWDTKNQKIKPPEEDYKNYNSTISLIKSKTNQAFLMLLAQDTTFTVEDIYNHYLGKPAVRTLGIIAYYKEYLEKNNKLIGIEIKQSTWNKFNYIHNDIKGFIKYKYNKADILLKDLDYSFILEFEYYLKTEKHQKQITVNKALQRLKKVVKAALIDKLIEFHPFVEHKPKKVITNVIYLTPEELHKLETCTFSQPRLEQVRDMFIFCCYTGLAYNEMSQLKGKHIQAGFDGMKWIKMIRDKTSKEISIPLLTKSANIIGKYDGIIDDGLLLPIISNQKFNSYLKEIAEIVGIEKKLTHHTARKTFATTVLLYNDVPMEIVSELLGHSKLSTTQEHYAKVVQKKVSEHIMELGKKLKG